MPLFSEVIPSNGIVWWRIERGINYLLVGNNHQVLTFSYIWILHVCGPSMNPLKCHTVLHVSIWTWDSVNVARAVSLPMSVYQEKKRGATRRQKCWYAMEAGRNRFGTYGIHQSISWHVCVQGEWGMKYFSNYHSLMIKPIRTQDLLLVNMCYSIGKYPDWLRL